MHFGVQENPGRYDNVDHDNDNENGATGSREWNCLT